MEWGKIIKNTQNGVSYGGARFESLGWKYWNFLNELNMQKVG